MTGHPTHGAPDTLLVKLCNQAYQNNLAAEIGALIFGLWRVKVQDTHRSRQASFDL